MNLDSKYLPYFEKQRREKNPIFWSRFEKIDLTGLKVLEIGCGQGSMCIDIAAKGAANVFGLDIDNQLIEFANQNLHKRFPQFTGIVSFLCLNLADLPEDRFDIIISKAAFEHVLNLEMLLEEMNKRLKTGGKIYTGFGPLYNSPWGDHKRTKAVIPWGHLILPQPFLKKRINKNRKNKINSFRDLGLNLLSLKQYKEIFNSSPLHTTDFRTNVSENKLSKLLPMICKIPFLREYFTFNIYCILEKKDVP